MGKFVEMSSDSHGLVRTMTLMEMIAGVEDNDPTIGFAHELDEESSRQHMLFLDADVWREMNKPEQITVTIQPGDKLNVAAG